MNELLTMGLFLENIWLAGECSIIIDWVHMAMGNKVYCQKQNHLNFGS